MASRFVVADERGGEVLVVVADGTDEAPVVRVDEEDVVEVWVEDEVDDFSGGFVVVDEETELLVEVCVLLVEADEVVDFTEVVEVRVLLLELVEVVVTAPPMLVT